MNSMTGFGKAISEADGRKVTIELKAVNHRYLDLSIKLPKLLNYCEDIIRKCLQERFSRGHIDVYVNYENKRTDSIKLTINEGLAGEYIAVKNEIAEKYGIIDDFTVSALIKSPDVISEVEEDEDEAVILQLVKSAIENAADNLNNMRAFEGEKIKNDILIKIGNIEKIVKNIKQRSPVIVQNYRIKLTEKITEALNGVQIDEARLLNEVAFFCDKASIDEEITRLDSHCQHAREYLSLNEPVGRNLDFLIQEFNREANTIGSKSNDIVITNYALELKSEIEKVREQIQNVE